MSKTVKIFAICEHMFETAYDVVSEADARRYLEQTYPTLILPHTDPLEGTHVVEHNGKEGAVDVMYMDTIDAADYSGMRLAKYKDIAAFIDYEKQMAFSEWCAVDQAEMERAVENIEFDEDYWGQMADDAMDERFE